MPRILIVDDEQSMREWLRILFQRDGFEVLIADDGLTAREIVAREFVDVVLTVSAIRSPNPQNYGRCAEVQTAAGVFHSELRPCRAP